ncbi:MAG TPA: hypothetical protein VEF89_11985 [Solirubrobacteraceae bacterium]|nr:hypothetical protein [Solirubrobacteraceae bacterium]
MSRSLRAWARTCELVGAAVRGARRLGKLEVLETLEAEPLVRSASSLTTLTWVATAVTLMLACSPALALGKSAGRGPGGMPDLGAARTPPPSASPGAQ